MCCYRKLERCVAVGEVRSGVDCQLGVIVGKGDVRDASLCVSCHATRSVIMTAVGMEIIGPSRTGAGATLLAFLLATFAAAAAMDLSKSN